MKVPRVEATGLAYAWPAKVSLDRLRAQGAWVLIERGRDGSLTLLSLLAPAPPPAPSGTRGGAAPGAAATGLAPEVSVRETLVEDAGAAIVDSAVSPATRVEITGARLVVRDLDMARKRRRHGRAARADARGREGGGERPDSASTPRASMSRWRFSKPTSPWRSRICRCAAASAARWTASSRSRGASRRSPCRRRGA